MTKTVTVRLTDDEWLWLRTAAQAAGRSLPRWLKNRALARAQREHDNGTVEDLPVRHGRPAFVSAGVEQELRRKR